jgi:hypothetical protein
MEKSTIFWGKGNLKLGKEVATFSLPAGFSCPFAKECRACVTKTGKLVRGKDAKFLCYAAKAELIYPTVRASRWRNFNLIRGKSVKNILNLLEKSLPKTKVVRLMASGDFSDNLFKAFLFLAKNHPGILFYGYTKNIPILARYRKQFPKNFRITASYGGTHDHLIEKHKLVSCKVVFKSELPNNRLPIDVDDSHCRKCTKNFGIVVH